MQRLLKNFVIINLLFPFFVMAFTAPETGPTAFVIDYAGILSVEQITSLEAKISAFEKNTSNDVFPEPQSVCISWSDIQH